MEIELSERVKGGYTYAFQKHWPWESRVANGFLEERDSAKQKQGFQRVMLF